MARRGGSGGGAYGLSVLGVKELQRALRATSKEAKKAVRDELKAAGNIVRDEIRDRAPRKSGKLKRSVKTRIRRLNVMVMSDARSTKSRKWPGYRYGKRLEFDPKFGGRYAFFYPGYEAKKREALARFYRVLDAIGRAFREG